MKHHVLSVLVLTLGCSGGSVLTALAVVADEPPATSQSDPATNNVATGQRWELTDRDIQLAVENKLLASDAVKSHRVHVIVEDGIVTLAGRVRNLLAEDIAVGLAQRIRGVESVVDQLEVNPVVRDDADLQQDIAAALAADPGTHEVKVVVTVKNRTVTSDFQRSFAEQRAWKAGAKDVDVRGIHVDWKHANPELRALRYEKATDDQIRNAVTRALRYDPRVLSFQPDVHVKHGVVTLSGTVGHLAALRAAERVAQFTVGVRRVDNRLQVGWPEASTTDEQIAEYTIAALHRDPYLNDEENTVGFKVLNGVAILEGSVATWYRWQQVLDSAMAAGAREPHMMIEVRNGTPVSLHYSGPHTYIPE